MESDDSKIDYYRDSALSGEKGDEFQHKHYVWVLKDILLKSETPINVGLYGRWGVGKSSIMHMLAEAIKNEPELEGFEYVEVDAWGISGKSLQQGILEEINAKLKFPYTQEELEDKLYNVHQVETIGIKKSLRNYWWIWPCIIGISISLGLSTQEDLAFLSSPISAGSIITILVPLSRLFLSSTKKIIPRTVSTFQFKKIYKHMVEKCKKKLVVVIDNLDRCEDTVAVELLGIIQTFMVEEDCINILACDDEAIVTHLKNVKKNYTDKDGNEFLSKFFQVTIRIPPFIGENLSSYAAKLIEKRNVTFSPFVKIILISGAIENPRKINQFLNIAVALYRLAEFKEEARKLQKDSITGHTDFLMKMIIIRHEWPEFYKALEISPSLLNDEKSRIRWYAEQTSEKIIKQEEIDRLKKFLNATKFSHVLDIAPFLRLNQESYAGESGIGNFEDAFITLDPKAVEIFEGLGVEKQDQYINKIKDLMRKYESEPEKLTLVNCALSLIDILSVISDESLRKISLAILGQYMSSEMLEHLDKFNIEELKLFEILKDMEEHFSEPIYDKLIDQIFENNQVDEDLLEKFFKNGAIIETKILDQVDSELSEKISTENYRNTEFISKCIKDYNWSENNISKPSKIVGSVLAKMDFDENLDEIFNNEFFAKIKDHLVNEEIVKFYELIQLKIKEYNKAETVLPPRLLEYLNNIRIEPSDSSSHIVQNIFRDLSNSIITDSDLTQNREILKLIISLYNKIIELPEQIISPVDCIDNAFVGYVKYTDADMIKNLLVDPLYHEFLEREKIIVSLIHRYQELGSNVPEIIRFLLKTKSYSAKKIIKSKSEKMISSNDESQFQTLLTIAQENNPEFNTDLIESIGQFCLKNAEDNENPNRYSMYEHALRLKLSSHDRSKISDYGINLIKNQKQAIQEQGFSLLRKFNSTLTEPVGINEAIKIAIELIGKKDQRAIRYIKFILEFKNHFGIIQKNKITELFKISLTSNTSELIINNIIKYIDQSTNEIIEKILDELVDFAKSTEFVNAKKRCKQIFINNKDNLDERRIKSIEEIFGPNVFG